MRRTFCPECSACPFYLVYRANRIMWWKICSWQPSWDWYFDCAEVEESLKCTFFFPYPWLWLTHSSVVATSANSVKHLGLRACLQGRFETIHNSTFAWGFCKSLKVLPTTYFQGGFSVSNTGSKIPQWFTFDFRVPAAWRAPRIWVPITLLFILQALFDVASMCFAQQARLNKAQIPRVSVHLWFGSGHGWRRISSALGFPHSINPHDWIP